MPDSYEQLKAHFDRISEKNREDHASLRTRLAEIESALQQARQELDESREENAALRDNNRSVKALFDERVVALRQACEHIDALVEECNRLREMTHPARPDLQAAIQMARQERQEILDDARLINEQTAGVMQTALERQEPIITAAKAWGQAFRKRRAVVMSKEGHAGSPMESLDEQLDAADEALLAAIEGQ